MNDPSNSEIGRRLDEAIAEIRGLADELKKSYVPREVYAADRRTAAAELRALEVAQQREDKEIRDDVQEIQEARKADLLFRRQILAGASVQTILLLISLVIAASNYIARMH